MDNSAAAEEEFNEMIGCIYPGNNGTFHWRPGPIGRAVEEGRWIVLEGLGGGKGNANMGPTTAVAALSRLRPGGELSVAGRGEKLTAATGFTLIATRTTSKGKHESNSVIFLLAKRILHLSCHFYLASIRLDKLSVHTTFRLCPTLRMMISPAVVLASV